MGDCGHQEVKEWLGGIESTRRFEMMALKSEPLKEITLATKRSFESCRRAGEREVGGIVGAIKVMPRGELRCTSSVILEAGDERHVVHQE